MVHVTGEVQIAQTWYLDNLQVMVQHDVDHSVQLLLWIFTNTVKVARCKWEVIEQYCSFKNQRKSLQDVSAQAPLSTAYSLLTAYNCIPA